MNGSNWWNPILRNECHIFSSKWVDSLCCLMRGRARGQKDRPFLATAQWVKPNEKVQKQNRLFIKVHVVLCQSITLLCQLNKECKRADTVSLLNFLFLLKIGLLGQARPSVSYFWGWFFHTFMDKEILLLSIPFVVILGCFGLHFFSE